jgi:hypothetical protein
MYALQNNNVWDCGESRDDMRSGLGCSRELSMSMINYLFPFPLLLHLFLLSLHPTAYTFLFSLSKPQAVEKLITISVYYSLTQKESCGILIFY